MECIVSARVHTYGVCEHGVRARTAVPDSTHAYIPPAPLQHRSYCLLTSFHHRSLLSPARTHPPSLTTMHGIRTRTLCTPRFIILN